MESVNQTLYREAMNGKVSLKSLANHLGLDLDTVLEPMRGELVETMMFIALPAQEMADILGVSVNNVYQKRKRLRDKGHNIGMVGNEDI